jgi:proteasome lid subunit RPN8/RPN11
MTRGRGVPPACLTLSAAACSEIRGEAATRYPNEACGLLLGSLASTGVHVTRTVPCENLADPDDRGHAFMIDPREIFAVGRADGAALVGFFHSHPDAEAVPSVADTDFLRLWPETAWLILPVRGGLAGGPRVWWLDNPHQPRPRELSVRVEQ